MHSYDTRYPLQKVCPGDKLEEDQAIAEACDSKTEGGRNKSPLPLMIYFIYLQVTSHFQRGVCIPQLWLPEYQDLELEYGNFGTPGL